MPGFLIVYCSCANEEEARTLANAAVERRLAACVNIVPSVTSIYRWKEVIQTATEYLLLAKTTEDSFPKLRDTLTEMHSYDNPEIVATPITYGADDYLAWIRQSV